MLLACLTSVHTNLSFVPVSKTTLLLPTLSCLHAPLTPCNRGSKPPLINQIILMPSGPRSCLQTQDLYPEQRMENLRDSPLSLRLKYGINGGVLWKRLMCTWMQYGSGTFENPSCSQGWFCHRDASKLLKPAHLCHISRK